MNYLKVSNLDETEDLKKVFRTLFIKITPKIEEIIFSNRTVFISCTNKLIFELIYNQLTKINIDIEKTTTLQTDFVNATSFVFPFPENEKVYDLIHVWTKNISKDLCFEINHLTEISKKDIVKNVHVCKKCYKETPEELKFCIFCGHTFSEVKSEKKDNFVLKIIKINDVNTRIKIAKYLCENSEYKDYRKMLSLLSSSSCNLELRTSNSNFNYLKILLDEYNVDYYASESKTIDKIINVFQSSINIGLVEEKNNYFESLILKGAIDIIKSSNSEVLKKALSKSIFESFRIVDFIKNSESTSAFLFEQTKKDIDEILLKFFNFIKRADKISTYFDEKSLEQINKEILFLKDKVISSSESSAAEIYKQSLELKEKEIEDYMKLSKSVEIIYSQIISVTTLLSSMRTKVAYISVYDVQNNKGDFTEINKMKDIIVTNLKAIEGTLY